MKVNVKNLFLSIFLSFLVVLTKITYPKIYTGNYNLKTFTYYDILTFILSLVIIYNILDYINTFKYYLNEDNKKVSNKIIVLIVSIISIIGFIFTYTESLTENTNVIWSGVLNDNVSNHHPIINSLFFLPGIYIYKITGIFKLGLIINELLLLIFNIFVYSLLNCYIYNKTKSTKYLIFSLLWTMLLPINFVFQSTVWKDTYFVNFSILFMILLYEILNTKFKLLDKKLYIIIFIVISLLMCLVRGNAIAPYCLLFAISLISFKRVNYKFLLTLFITIILYLGLTSKILPKFYKTDSSKAETSAIYLSFMSRIIIEDYYIEESDKNFMEIIIPEDAIRDNYNSNCIDSIKFNTLFNDDFFNENHSKFKSTIKKYVIKYPITFIKTYLINTYQFWSLYTPDYTAGSIWYFISKTPIINLITCPIIYLILYLFISFKNKDYSLLYIFIFGVYITIYCCSPVNISIRYLYIIFPNLPLLLLPLLKKKTS